MADLALLGHVAKVAMRALRDLGLHSSNQGQHAVLLLLSTPGALLHVVDTLLCFKVHSQALGGVLGLI